MHVTIFSVKVPKVILGTSLVVFLPHFGEAGSTKVRYVDFKLIFPNTVAEWGA